MIFRVFSNLNDSMIPKHLRAKSPMCATKDHLLVKLLETAPCTLYKDTQHLSTFCCLQLGLSAPGSKLNL